MKFFLDTANVDEITELASTGLVDGITTNPSLIAASGRNMIEVIKEITELVDGPVSAEVTATDYDTMLAEGRILSEIAKNVADFFNSNIDIRVSGDFRIGDIRHNFADVQKINKLGINSKEFIPFEEGYKRFLNWAKETGSTSFNVEEATRIMKDSGMYHES